MPTLPEKVWVQLGIANKKDLHTWDSLTWGGFPAGVKIERGEALFPRIDLKALEEELAAEPAEEAKPAFEPIFPEITIEDFAKIDLRVAKVLACEKVEKADKLLKSTLLVGDEERVVVSGIAQYYKPRRNDRQACHFSSEFKPIKLRGIESKGMILAASHDGKLEVVEVKEITPGGRVK